VIEIHLDGKPVTIGRTCEMDGVIEDTYGAEHYWNCGRPGAITVDGKLLCEDHAGELGYGPKQEEYGFDPHDGLNPTPDLAAQLTEWIKAEGITGNYPPDQIADRVVAQIHPSRLTAWLDQGAGYLRDMCTRIKDETDLTDAERAAELFWHGHHPH
jgi:hypothetical protein